MFFLRNRFFKKEIAYASSILIFCLVILIPSVHRKVGDIFFGSVPVLYNVTFAQFFYTYATNPLIGTSAPYAHHQLSRTYFIQGKFTPALEQAQKELEEYPNHWNTYYIIGLTLGYMDREEEAVEAFGKFIEHKPESWAARNDRAWLQFRIGDIDGALATLEPVVTLTTNPWIQNTYGTILLNKKRYTEAKQAFEYARISADLLTEDLWGNAYPGNDPRVYSVGLEAMRTSIKENLRLIDLLIEQNASS